MRARGAWICPAVLVALLAVSVGTEAQTYPADVSGHAAPPGVYQDSLGAFQTVGPSFPMPVSSSGLTPDPLLDSYGFGRFWFLAQTAPFAATQPVSGFFVDDSTVVAIQKATGGNCIQQFRSIDGGRTYATTGGCQVIAGVSLGGNRTAFLVPNGNLLVAGNVTATDPGIEVSTSGQFFSVASISPALNIGGNVNAFNVQGGTILAAVDDGGGTPTLRACRSADNGLTWTCVAVPAVAFTSQTSGGGVLTPGPNTWIIASSDGANARIFRSTDNGVTWTSVANIAPTAALGERGGGACLTSTVCVFAIGGMIVRSTDGGVTWTKVFDSGGDEQLINLVAYNATTAIALSWAGFGAHYRTTNGGATWSAVPNVGCGTGAPNGASTASARKGRAVFFTPGASCAFFSPSLGQNPNPVVNSKGEGGVYQGTPAQGPNAWPTSVMQAGTLLNVQQTSAAGSAQTITLAGVSALRVTVHSIVCFISALGGASPTITIQDGAGFIMNLGVFHNLNSAPFVANLGPMGMTGNSGNSITVNIGAPTAPRTSTCSVLAYRL